MRSTIFVIVALALSSCAHMRTEWPQWSGSMVVYTVDNDAFCGTVEWGDGGRSLYVATKVKTFWVPATSVIAVASVPFDCPWSIKSVAMQKKRPPRGTCL